MTDDLLPQEGLVERVSALLTQPGEFARLIELAEQIDSGVSDLRYSSHDGRDELLIKMGRGIAELLRARARSDNRRG